MPLAVTGSWVKDGHRFSISEEDLDDIVKNFDKRLNGEVVVDYEHASERPEVARAGPVPAAGWIKELAVRADDDGRKALFGKVEWDDDARELIKAKKYKYFSPAIDWGAVDKKTGRSKGATITSGALTNHPFLEELPAIQLGERAAVQLSEQAGAVSFHILEASAVEKFKEEREEHDSKHLEDSTAGDADHATVSGTKVHKSDFAYVGDPADKGTWKLPIHDKSHAQNALARFNQADIPSSAKKSVASKLVRKANSYGIDTSGFKKEHLSEESMSEKEKDEKKEMSAKKREENKKKNFAEMTDQQIMSEMGQMLDDIDAYGVEGDRGAQESLRKEAEKRAGKIDTEDDEAQTLSDKKNKKKPPAEDDDPDNELQASAAGGGGLPRFKMRQIKAADGVGKVGHHGLIAADGKLAGYVTHAHLMAHAKDCGMSEAGRSEGTMKASEKDFEELLLEKTGRPLTLSDAVKLVETGISSDEATKELEATQSRQASRKLMLSSAMSAEGEFVPRAARGLLADNKISMRDLVDFENAVEDVDKAIKEGKFLPNQRKVLVQLCLSDSNNFDLLVKGTPKTQRTEQLGVGGTGRETASNPDTEVEDRIKQLMKEPGNDKMTYGQAYTKVLASDASLKKRYEESHRKLM
jgi:phage I-like protein